MLGEIISGVSNLVGGYMQAKNQRRQEKLQKEFAQTGVQWKVADAKKAGINPYFALGANTTSYTPQSVGDMGFGAAGQDFGRAANAYENATGKAGKYSEAVQRLSLRRMELENQLLASKIATTNQPGTPPGLPSSGNRYLLPGQSGSAATASGIPGLIVDQPLKRTASAPEAPSQEPGAVTDVGFGRSPQGYPVTPSDNIKNKIEDMFLAQRAWELRNMVLPSFGLNYNPPPVPKGQKGKGYWWYHPVTQEYVWRKGPKPWYIWGGRYSFN